MNKECKTCKEVKDLDEFPLQDKKKGTYRTECKVCYSQRRKKAYQENPEKAKERASKNYHNNKEKAIERVNEYRANNPEKVKQWSKAWRKKRQEEWYAYKCTLSCSNCGFSHPAVIDFHHVDGEEKERLISKSIYSTKKLEKELEKCVPLCANCHRILHHNLKQQKNV